MPQCSPFFWERSVSIAFLGLICLLSGCTLHVLLLFPFNILFMMVLSVNF